MMAKAINYTIVDDILYHLAEPRNKNMSLGQTVIKQLVVPDSLKGEILKSYHDSLCGSHYSTERTFYAIKQKYFWEVDV